MNKRKSPYPKWVDKHRKPGTEIRRIGGRFYIYEVSAYYDPKRKKGRKKTGKYLGRITEKDGFIEAASRKMSKTYAPAHGAVSTKEYGLWAFMQEQCNPEYSG